MPFTNRLIGNAYRARRAAALVQAGLCCICGKRPRVNRNHCAECQEAANARVRQYKDANRDRHNARVREVTSIRRSQVFQHYGGECQCCGEREPMFLTLDHKNGGGTKDPRFKSASGTRLTAAQFYNKVIKLGFPSDLQLLCYNCNCGRHRNGGTCPHAEKVEWNQFPSVRNEQESRTTAGTL